MTAIDNDDGPAPLEAGALLAPGYAVVAHLRRGENLDVYDLWSDERMCRCVGKVIRPDRQSARGAVTRLLRDGGLLLRLTHPHIVRAYEIIRDPAPMVILETLPGETLAHLIDRHPRGLPAQDVAHLGIHVCSAIGYLHRQRVLHLDIKPSNVVASHGLAKVLDLSLARAPGRHRGGTGTTGYMAPEQVEGGVYGPHTDVWAIGATLFEAATGEPACEVEGDEGEGTTRDISQEVCVPEPVRNTRRVATPLAALIDQALSREPSERPAVDELRAGLEAVVLSGEQRR